MREVVIMMLAKTKVFARFMCVCFDWMTWHFFFEDLSVLIWETFFCQCVVTSLSTCVRECAWEFTLLGHLRWPPISISLSSYTHSLVCSSFHQSHQDSPARSRTTWSPTRTGRPRTCACVVDTARRLQQKQQASTSASASTFIAC